MNNIRDIRQSNIEDVTSKTVHRNNKDKVTQSPYFTDEALEDLIAGIEAEGMLHPPKGFHDEVISRIRRKRKYKKNLQLFSYSMKVITATAAAIGIILIVPDNISTQESPISAYMSEWQASDGIQDVRKRSQNKERREEGKTTQEQNQDAQEKEESAQEEERKKEKKYVWSTKKSYDEQFIYKLNKQMDEYVSIVNGKLNQFVRMEVNFNEEEEK